MIADATVAGVANAASVAETTRAEVGRCSLSS